MAAVEITPAMVLEVTPISQERAERIAAYASLRFGGLLVVDAAREADVSETSARSYDRWLPLLRAQFDLPEPPRANPEGHGPNFERGRQQSAHLRHVRKGTPYPNCPLCQESAR